MEDVKKERIVIINTLNRYLHNQTHDLRQKSANNTPEDKIVNMAQDALMHMDKNN